MEESEEEPNDEPEMNLDTYKYSEWQRAHCPKGEKGAKWNMLFDNAHKKGHVKALRRMVL